MNARRLTHFSQTKVRQITIASRSKKQMWQKLNLGPNTTSLSDFFEDLKRCVERVFRPLTQQILESFLYSNLARHLKRSINLSYSEKTYDQVFARIEREVDLKYVGWKQIVIYLVPQWQKQQPK